MRRRIYLMWLVLVVLVNSFVKTGILDPGPREETGVPLSPVRWNEELLRASRVRKEDISEREKEEDKVYIIHINNIIIIVGKYIVIKPLPIYIYIQDV